MRQQRKVGQQEQSPGWRERYVVDASSADGTTNEKQSGKEPPGAATHHEPMQSQRQPDGYKKDGIAPGCVPEPLGPVVAGHSVPCCAAQFVKGPWASAHQVPERTFSLRCSVVRSPIWTHRLGRLDRSTHGRSVDSTRPGNPVSTRIPATSEWTDSACPFTGSRASAAPGIHGMGPRKNGGSGPKMLHAKS